jgi:hypothetical protein
MKYAPKRDYLSVISMPPKGNNGLNLKLFVRVIARHSTWLGETLIFGTKRSSPFQEPYYFKTRQVLYCQKGRLSYKLVRLLLFKLFRFALPLWVTIRLLVVNP